MSETLLRESDNGAAVTVASGDQLVVDLPENPTTGYRWEIETTGVTLTRRSASFTVLENTGTGGGGRRRFAFVAGHSGEGVVHASLRRPWEPEGKAIAHYALTIRIE